MRQVALLGILLLLCLGGQGGCGPSRAGFEQIYTGMLQEQVHSLLGAPRAYDPKQWVYEPGPFNSRIVIDYIDGRVSNKSWGEAAAPAPGSQPAAPPATVPSTQPAAKKN